MENTKDKTTGSRRKCKHITDSDRQIIEKLHRKGYSVAQIADLLDFHRSSIYRELHRGRVIHLNSQLEEYVTYSSDRASDEARSRASAYGPSLKIGNDFALVNEFNHLILHHKLSLFAARQVIMQRGIDVHVSLRTLYNYVHCFGFPILPENLLLRPRKQSKKPVRKRLAHNNVLAQSIEQRPEHINDRSELGHHEMDTVLGLPAPLMYCLSLPKEKQELNIFCL